MKDANGSLTFQELLNQAGRLAAAVRERVAGCNQPVAVFLPKSKECVVAFAAVLLSGNCYAPLDLKSPASRLAALAGTLRPALVITDQAHFDDAIRAGIETSRILVWEFQAGVAVPLPAIRCLDTDPVYIIHTSGSTGVPKGVVIPHRGVIDYIEWARECYAVDEDDTIGSQAPFHFDNSTLDLYLCFATGATLVLIPDEFFAFPIRLIEFLCEQQVNLIFWVPSVLVQVAKLDILGKTALPPLRKILFAGEVMPTSCLNYWRSKCPDALFSNLYGPTEITVDCTYYTVDREFADDEPLPIGFPRHNLDVLVLNDRNEVATAGERGELCVRGSALAHGYWNDPERTAAAFVQNPLNPHYPERIYRTGDIVYRNERNEIMYAGRRDNQVKHLGYRIELGEIESAAMTLPEIRSVCVLYDAAGLRIVMFYEAGAGLSPAGIRTALLAKLPKYMLPTLIRQVDEMPLNSSGKIDRGELAAGLRT